MPLYPNPLGRLSQSLRLGTGVVTSATPLGFALNGASNLATKAMLARVKAGTGRGKIVFMSDSLTQGIGTGSDSPKYVVGARAQRLPTYLASSLSTAGVPSIDKGFVGDCGITATGSGSYASFDPRVATSGAIGVNADLTFAGGGYWLPSGNGAWTLSFTETNVDTFDVVVFAAANTRTTVSIDGAAPASGNAYYDGQTGGGFLRFTFPAGSVGTHTIQLSASGAAPAVRSIRGYVRGSSAVDMVVLGACGAQASQQATTDTSNMWKALDALTYEAPDLVVIQLGANDINNSVSTATTITNLQTIITAAKSVNADVLLCAFHPAAGQFASSQPALASAIKSLAQSAGVSLMSFYDYYGGDPVSAAFSARLADGLVHAKADVYQEEGNLLGQCVQAMATIQAQSTAPAQSNAPITIAFGGSSTPEKYFTTYSGASNTNVTYASTGTGYSTSGAFQQLTSGRLAMDLGNSLNSSTGRPVRYLAQGVGGSKLSDWVSNAGSYRTNLTTAMAAVGQVDLLYLQVGYNDLAENTASDGTTQTTAAGQAAKIRSVISQVRSEAGMPNLPVLIGTTQDSSGTPAALYCQRMAEMTVINNDQNVRLALFTGDLPTADGVHQTDAGQQTATARLLAQVKALIAGTTQSRGPSVSAALAQSNTTTLVTLTHRSGNDFTPVSGISGFVMYDSNGAALTVNSAVRQSATTILLTHASTNGNAASLMYDPNGASADDATQVHDNGPLTLPMEPSAQLLAITPVIQALAISGTPASGTVGAAYSFAPSVSGGSGSRTFSTSGTALPAGLSLSTSTGAINGTPTTAATTNGIVITVTDSSGSASETVSITIAAAATSGQATGKLIKLNHTNSTFTQADSSWNMFNDDAAATTIAAKLPNGTASGWSAYQPGSYGNANSGVTSGNNSYIYPDAVTQFYWYVSANGTMTITLSGLDPSKRYDIDLYASRNDSVGSTTARLTDYVIGGVTKTQNSTNNTSTISTFAKTAPASDGTIVILAKVNSGSSVTNVYWASTVVTEYNA